MKKNFRNLLISPVIGVVLISSTLTVVASSLTLNEAAQNLDPFVESVFLCGNWKYKNEEGRFRIIHGWLWGHTEIYVQWLADPIWYPKKSQKERREPLLMKTISFPEFNDYHAETTLENIKCSQKDNHWVITADADNGHEDDSKLAKYRILIYLYDEPGKHKLATKSVTDSSSAPTR